MPNVLKSFGQAPDSSFAAWSMTLGRASRSDRPSPVERRRVRTGTVGDTSDDRQPEGRNEATCGADVLERTTRGVDSCVAGVLRTISRQTGTGVAGLRFRILAPGLERRRLRSVLPSPRHDGHWARALRVAKPSDTGRFGLLRAVAILPRSPASGALGTRTPNLSR